MIEHKSRKYLAMEKRLKQLVLRCRGCKRSKHHGEMVLLIKAMEREDKCHKADMVMESRSFATACQDKAIFPKSSGTVSASSKTHSKSNTRPTL